MSDRSEFVMSVIKKIFIPVMLFLTFAMGLLYAMGTNWVWADGREYGDHDRYEWGERHGHDDDEHEGRDQRRGKGQKLPENAAYANECSGCHLPYQPWLLPARSWEKLMDGTEDHFGDDLALDAKVIEEIKNYLFENSAENTGVRNEWTGPRGKIIRSLKGAAPERIREVPYIRKEHKKQFRKNVFERESIKSFANCGACHKTAAEGDYEEDNIKVPKK